MSLVGKTIEEQVWNFSMVRVGNAYGVAALMGNLDAESGLNPKNLENLCERRLKEAGKSYCTDETYTAAVDSGKIGREEFLHPLPNKQYGYGLPQWTSEGRKAGLYDYVKSKGVSIGDLEAQLEYLFKELSTSYKSVLNALKSASSVREASDIVLTKFECPADQGEAVKVKRAGYGQKFFEKYAGSALNGGNNMSVRIGHASISEKGTINGVKGDQTGGEVCTRTFYSKPWDYAAIHPDAIVREKHAQAVESACANDNIGYGQNDRNTLNTLAKAVGYDLSRVGKCNCDCSSLQNVAAVASGAGATYGSNGWTTSTMKAALQKLGYKIITDATYLANAKYCVRGAIYVRASSHTVCALDNGAEYKKTLEKAGISKTSASGSSSNVSCQIGDVVSFTGTKHYSSANDTSPKACKPGKAKITAVSAGARHPYHLVHTDSTSTVYGWVDAGDIGSSASGGSSGTRTHKVVSGDTLSAIANKNGTTVAKIVAANKGKYPKITANYIVVGWTLSIPQ